jgi:hypothetical protein
MAAIRSPPTLEVNLRPIEGTNLASSNPTFGCGLASEREKGSGRRRWPPPLDSERRDGL